MTETILVQPPADNPGSVVQHNRTVYLAKGGEPMPVPAAAPQTFQAAGWTAVSSTSPMTLRMPGKPLEADNTEEAMS